MIIKSWELSGGLSIVMIAEGSDGKRHLLKDNVIIESDHSFKALEVLALSKYEGMVEM